MNFVYLILFNVLLLKNSNTLTRPIPMYELCGRVCGEGILKGVRNYLKRLTTRTCPSHNEGLAVGGGSLLNTPNIRPPILDTQGFLPSVPYFKVLLGQLYNLNSSDSRFKVRQVTSLP